MLSRGRSSTPELAARAFCVGEGSLLLQSQFCASKQTHELRGAGWLGGVYQARRAQRQAASGAAMQRNWVCKSNHDKVGTHAEDKQQEQHTSMQHPQTHDPIGVGTEHPHM